MKEEKIEKKNSYFSLYDLIFSIITLGFYMVIKMQKINYDFESLNKEIKTCKGNYKYDLENRKTLHDQKIANAENEKKEKDKRIFELQEENKKRVEQIQKIIKDKDDQLSKFLKEKDEQIKLKDSKISELNNTNGNLKKENEILNLEKIKNEEKIKSLEEKSKNLETRMAIEKNENISAQLINKNPYNCSTTLTDHVRKTYEECFGDFQKYAKLESEKNIQTENQKNKRADFIITFYRQSAENNTEISENFKVVIECKSHDQINNKEKLIDNNYFRQLIEYSRLFNAKFAILLTNLKVTENDHDFYFKCINDWSQLKIKGIFKKPNDADLFIVRPDHFSLFLKIFRFLNDSTNLSFGKIRKINKAIDSNTIWEFINQIKTEIACISELKTHIQYIEERNKKTLKAASEISKRIQARVIPSIEQISDSLYEKSDNLEIALPQETKKITPLNKENISDNVEIKKQDQI